MADVLANSRCVVTGASSGIGAATARALADRGAAVVGLARRFDRAQSVDFTPGEVSQVRLDITDEQAVPERFNDIGSVDVLVNAAGLGTFGPVIDADVAAVRDMLEVSVVGTLLCCQGVLPGMVSRGSGHIINIGSIAAVRPLANSGPYGAAKAGQRLMTRALGEEVRGRGVIVTSLVVGAVDTPIWDARPEFDRTGMLRPEQVADVIVNVASRPDVYVEEMEIVPPGGVLRADPGKLARRR